MPFPNLNGRPTKYTEDMPEKVLEYIQECNNEGIPPTKAGFAGYINVVKKTLYNWAGEYPEFLHSLEKLDDFQEQDLIRYSLKGEYNSTIAKLLLQNNHGYSDKVQTENTNVNANVEGDEDESVEDKLEKVLKRIQKLRKD